MIDGTICPKCGKEFFPYPDHVYKVGSQRYCSWTCFSHRDDEKPPKQYHYKAVEQYTLDGEYLREFESAKKAAEFIGCTASAIASACRQENGRARKFIWKYKN